MDLKLQNRRALITGSSRGLGYATARALAMEGAMVAINSRQPEGVMEAAKITYLEMTSNRENAWCCGAGGGARAAYPDWSLLTAKKRLEHANGCKSIVTACPFCVRNLRDASEEHIEVVDIVEIIDRIT